MKKTIIEFSIEQTSDNDAPPIHEPMNDTQLEYQSWLKTQSPLDQEGVFEQLVFVDQTSPETTSSPSSQASSTISGNLLGEGIADNILLQIEGHLISDVIDSEGKAVIEHDQGGTLTLFTQATQEHQAGDFIYAMGPNQSSHSETFEYKLLNEHGIQATFQLNFDITEKGIQMGEPELSSVAEGGLLPGQHDLLNTFGDLNIDLNLLDGAHLGFAPLIEQQALIEAQLTSHGQALYYSISDDNTVIEAHQGANGAKVFQAKVHEDGSYSFELNAPLDHEPPSNLITDPQFSQLKLGKIPLLDGDKGWHSQDTDVIALSSHENLHANTVSQPISVEPGAPYLLSLTVKNLIENHEQVDIFWNDKLIQTVQSGQAQSYAFALEGGDSNVSELTLVGTELSHPMYHYIENVHLSSMAVQKLPIELLFQVSDEQDLVLTDTFTVNVNTEPSIMVHHEPQMIVYDQGVYQSIVVSEQSVLGSPLATLNLEALFEKLNIGEDERQVEVVQLIEDNGQSTNTYEVKIIDKAQSLEPISVADVQLSFPGGEGGLDVFYKHIQILES